MTASPLTLGEATRIVRDPRLWGKVVEATDGCWYWLGGRSTQGYGRVTRKGKQHQAHRYVYERLVGETPEGLSLDHLCRNRACVNPAHLEPVSFRENVLRGESFAAANAEKTHCAHGHELAPDNVYSYRGRRRCRTCGHRWTRNWRGKNAR